MGQYDRWSLVDVGFMEGRKENSSIPFIQCVASCSKRFQHFPGLGILVKNLVQI